MRSSGFVTLSTLEALLLRTEAGVKTRNIRSRKMFSIFNYINSKATCMFNRKRKMNQKSREKIISNGQSCQNFKYSAPLPKFADKKS